MPERESPKLQEDYQKLEKKEIKKKLEEDKKALKSGRANYNKIKIKKFLNDLIYVLIISAAGGFLLWVWLPEKFTILKSFSIGVIWYLLFEELKLHRMFKKE